SIAHQPPDRGKFTAEVEGSHPMPCRKHDDLRRTIEKKRIDSNGKGIDAPLPEGCECRIDLSNGTRVEDYHLPPDIGSRGPDVVQLSIDIRHIRIDENADGRCIGSQLTQEPEPLRLQLSLKPAVAGEIAAGPMQVGNQPAADWIRCDGKDNGEGWGCGLGEKRSNITADGNNDCNLPADEIGGQCSKPTVISLRPAVFDRHAAAFDKTGVIQPLSNDSDQECIGRPRTAAQDTDNRKLLLCARREWQRSRAANQRDELATFQRIEFAFGPRQPGPDCSISNWRGAVSGCPSPNIHLRGFFTSITPQVPAAVTPPSATSSKINSGVPIGVIRSNYRPPLDTLSSIPKQKSTNG